MNCTTVTQRKDDPLSEKEMGSQLCEEENNRFVLIVSYSGKIFEDLLVFFERRERRMVMFFH